MKALIYIQKQSGILIVPSATCVDFFWQEYVWFLCLMDCGNPSESNNMATHFHHTVHVHSFFPFFLCVYFSHSLSLTFSPTPMAMEPSFLPPDRIRESLNHGDHTSWSCYY